MQPTDIIMCVLTGVYVIATAILVWFNWRTIEEMKNDRAALYRPYIEGHFGVVQQEASLYLIIKNRGQSSAVIKSAHIEPNINLVKGENDLSFLNGYLLAPSQSFDFMFLPPEDVDEKGWLPEGDFRLTVDYEQSGEPNKRYKETYVLNAEYAREEGWQEHKDAQGNRKTDLILDDIYRTQYNIMKKQL